MRRHERAQAKKTQPHIRERARERAREFYDVVKFLFEVSAGLHDRFVVAAVLKSHKSPERSEKMGGWGGRG